MKREFNYDTISFQDIENNLHLNFICEGDNKKVKVENEGKMNEEIDYKTAYENVMIAYKMLLKENEKLKEKIKSLSSKSISKKLYGEYKHVRLTDKEVQMLIDCYGKELTNQLITYLDEYIEMKGYKAKNHYLCIKKWVIDAVNKNKRKGNYSNQVELNRKMPDWFDKENKSESATSEEQNEMEEILKAII